jgi:hypothetical protein
MTISQDAEHRVGTKWFNPNAVVIAHLLDLPRKVGRLASSL